MNEQAANSDLIDLAAEIVSAYVSNNSVPASDLPTLIAEVHRALSSTHAGTSEPEPDLVIAVVPLILPVPVKT